MDDPTTERDPAPDADDLAAVRAALLRAYPDAIPELVGGATVSALLISLEEATAVFQRIAAAAQEARPATPPAPAVPAGAGTPLAPDPDRLPPVEKIRRGLLTR